MMFCYSLQLLVGFIKEEMMLYIGPILYVTIELGKI